MCDRSLLPPGWLCCNGCSQPVNSSWNKCPKVRVCMLAIVCAFVNACVQAFYQCACLCDFVISCPCAYATCFLTLSCETSVPECSLCVLALCARLCLHTVYVCALVCACACAHVPNVCLRICVCARVLAYCVCMYMNVRVCARFPCFVRSCCEVFVCMRVVLTY